MTRPGVDSLTVTSVAFVAANALHTAEHIRQGIHGLSWELLAAGSMLSVLAVATLLVTLRHAHRAPLIAAAVGLFAAGGVALSHLAPYWSVLSDPYPAVHVDLLSWTVMLAELAAALLLAVAGVSARGWRARPVRWTKPVRTGAAAAEEGRS